MFEVCHSCVSFTSQLQHLLMITQLWQWWRKKQCYKSSKWYHVVRLPVLESQAYKWTPYVNNTSNNISRWQVNIVQQRDEEMHIHPSTGVVAWLRIKHTQWVSYDHFCGNCTRCMYWGRYTSLGMHTSLHDCLYHNKVTTHAACVDTNHCMC